MTLHRRLPAWLQIALPIFVLIGVATVFAIWHDKAHPESDHVARMAAKAIARDTGRPVKSVSCPRLIDFGRRDELRCKVTFADGATYVTTATIYTKGGPGQRDYVDAHFTLPPRSVPVNPPAKQGVGQANDIQACLSQAGTDPAKLQACVK